MWPPPEQRRYRERAIQLVDQVGTGAMLVPAIAAALEAVRVETLEEAARECEDRFNPDMNEGHGATANAECIDCAEAVRSLMKGDE